MAHAAAQSAHGATHRMLAITDTETVTVRGDEWEITDHATRYRIRPAQSTDQHPLPPTAKLPLKGHLEGTPPSWQGPIETFTELLRRQFERRSGRRSAY